MSDRSESETEMENIFGTQISKLDFGDPLYLHASDTVNSTLVNFKLKGTENYKVWACAMELALETKNKIGFIDGTCIRSETNVVLAKQWDRCNSVVLTWILNSVTEELYLGQIFSKTASVVWQELKETYDKVDGAVMFNLHHKISSLTQNGDSISEYYHKLNSLWRQYDVLVKLPSCVCDAAKSFSEHSQLIKLMQFLMGLNDIYQPIRSTILTQDPLPNVKTAFAIISREESHRGLNLTDGFKNQTSSFAAKSSDIKRTSRNSNLLCNKCGRVGHIVERCFEIIGYPESFKKGSGLNSNFVCKNVV